jgi:uncharacterized coiled-coil protein SlyX
MDDRPTLRDLEERITLQGDTIARQHRIVSEQTLALASCEAELKRLRAALDRIAALKPNDTGAEIAAALAKQARRP